MIQQTCDGAELDADLSFVSAEHLASLVSCVTGGVIIRNVCGCDLVSIFTSLKCVLLSINDQSFGKEETRALVQAMDSRVGMVELGKYGEVTLDIGVLTEYNVQGMCIKILLDNGTVARYRKEIRVRLMSGYNGYMKITQDYDLLFRLENTPHSCV